MLRIKEWVAYSDDIDKKYKEAPFDDAHKEAVINALIKSDEIIFGDMHQSYNYKGIPVFKDGYLMVSMRTWGGLMAEAMNIKKKVGKYKYIDFYMAGGTYV